jgi:hypothetical protein
MHFLTYQLMGAGMNCITPNASHDLKIFSNDEIQNIHPKMHFDIWENSKSK